MKVDTYRHARKGIEIHVPAGTPVPQVFEGEPLRLSRANWEDDTPETIQAIERQGWREIRAVVFMTETIGSNPPI